MLNPQSKYYKQVQSLRDLTGSNFNNGQIRFNFSIPPEESWNPYQSYFRIRSKWDGYSRKYLESGSDPYTEEAKLNYIDGIAPSQYFNDQFWQQIEMRINGVCINKQDNYCGQIAALRHRMRPLDWNRTYGDINFHSLNFNERAKRLVYDGHQEVAGECSDGWMDVSELIDYKWKAASINNGAIRIVATGVASATATITLTAGVNWLWLAMLEFLDDDTDEKIGTTIMVRTKFDVNATNYRFLKYRITDIAVNVLSVTLSAGAGVEQVSDVLANAYIGMNIFKPGTMWVQAKCRPRYNALPVKQLETIWRPQLGFFQINDWIPGGEYEICLTPFPSGSLKQNIIESKLNNVTDVSFEILTMEFNAAVAKYSSTKNSIKFEEIRCQAKTLNTTSLTQKQFVLNPKTKSITIAYQDNRVSNRFDIPQTKFTIKDDTSDEINYNWEHNLSRYYIQYDGMVLPNPIPDIRRTGTDDFIAQQYWETTYHKMLLFDEVETFDQWKEAGMYFHYNWPRQSDTATEIQISQEFKGSLPVGPLGSLRPQLLLFEHCIKEFGFELYQNYITKVSRNY